MTNNLFIRFGMRYLCSLGSKSGNANDFDLFNLVSGYYS
jgi:hypothetical protein